MGKRSYIDLFQYPSPSTVTEKFWQRHEQNSNFYSLEMVLLNRPRALLFGTFRDVVPVTQFIRWEEEDDQSREYFAVVRRVSCAKYHIKPLLLVAYIRRYQYKERIFGIDFLRWTDRSPWVCGTSRWMHEHSMACYCGGEDFQPPMVVITYLEDEHLCLYSVVQITICES